MKFVKPRLFKVEGTNDFTSKCSFIFSMIFFSFKYHIIEWDPGNIVSRDGVSLIRNTWTCKFKTDLPITQIMFASSRVG